MDYTSLCDEANDLMTDWFKDTSTANKMTVKECTKQQWYMRKVSSDEDIDQQYV